MRRVRIQLILSACAALAGVLALASPVRATGEADAARDSLAAFRSLLRAHLGAQALARASAWEGALERAHASDTLRAAALDGWSEALLDQGAWGDSSSHATAARAVAVRERLAGPASPDFAGSLLTQAWLLYRGSRAAEARPIVERALAIAAAAGVGQERLLYRSLHLRAAVLEDAAEFALADSCYHAELVIARAIENPEGELAANTENSMAVLARKTGRLSDARPLYEHSLAIRERLLDHDDPNLAFSHNNLANVLIELGDLPGAVRHHTLALGIRERTMGPMHPQVAASLHNLAIAELGMGDTAKAEAHFRRALAIREAKLSPYDLSLGQTQAAIALLAAARGDSATGRRLARASLVAYEHSLGPRHPATANQHGHLGDVERFAGDPTGAIAEYETALRILESSLGPDASALIEELTALGGAELAAGRDSLAFAHAERAESLAVRDLENVASVLEERAALDYDTAVRRALDVMLSAACTRPRNAARVAASWDAIMRSRALVLDAQASRHRALLAGADDETRRLADSLSAAREHLAHLVLLGGAGPHDRAALVAAADQRDALEEALARRSAVFERDRRSRGAGLAELAAALPPGEALVAFARFTPAANPAGGADRMVAFVLRGGERGSRLVELGPAAAIDARVTAWRREAGTRPSPLHAAADEARCRAAGARLRQAAWDPFATWLARERRVSIVPEGGLQAVNFAALPDRDRGWLAESGSTFVVLGAERDRLELAVGGHGRGLLAVADPDFEAESGRAAPAAGGAEPAGQVPYRGSHSTCRDFGALRFAPLPSSAREVSTLAALWSREASREPIERLTAARASESAFKRLAPGRRELHVATHGFVFDGECPGVAAENPLVRCGFALAGANHRDRAASGADDGVLTGEEIGSLDLTGVDCAVLSACESGLGEVHVGEGVLGLRRAFRVAGVRAVVMSLWAVGDAETAEWMSVFDRLRLERGLDPATALAEAQREILRRRRAAGLDTHPWSWGAFVASSVGGAASPVGLR